MIFLAVFPVKGRNRDQPKKDDLMKTMTKTKMIPKSLTSPLEKISALTTETELYISQGSAIAVAGLWRRQCDLSLWEIQRRKLIEVTFPNHKDLEAIGYHFRNLLSSGLWRKSPLCYTCLLLQIKKINY